jgi:hypothetical protein
MRPIDDDSFSEVVALFYDLRNFFLFKIVTCGAAYVIMVAFNACLRSKVISGIVGLSELGNRRVRSGSRCGAASVLTL